ncbi:glycoside hydrolase family 2 protein [Rhodotorula sp. JG-1b]|nr:glycoside hydrolase family 2 protein [Rhodotorula sp. JG-1b]
MRRQQLDDPSLWSWAQAPAALADSFSTDDNAFPERLPPDVADLLATVSWRTCTQLPSQIHVELVAAELIPDPSEGLNEQRVQWVGEACWIYSCRFDLEDHKSGASNREPSTYDDHLDLVFDGLDTFATVYLNGRKVLVADNMFRSWRVDVGAHAQPKDDLMYIVFPSAFRRGRQLEEATLGRDKHWPCWNGDPSRIFVRKAGYNYGWDWGPTLMTAGPFRPVRVERYQVRIVDFFPRATVSADLVPKLSLSWQTSDAPTHLVVVAQLSLHGGAKVCQASWSSQNYEKAEWTFNSDEVELWWTHGQGKQPLYDVQLDLVDERNGEVLDSVTRKVGFRRIELVRAPLPDGENGHTFVFLLNNTPLFLGGSNWIPIDSFLTNGTQARYRRLLEMARDGNQTMVRVWGGGVYEEDIFYETCDELGLLVWQDFMFACAAYPAQLDDFRRNVEKEALEQVKRLRSHPCIAIFAGNNEDYQIAEAEKLRYDPDDTEGDWLATNFPARELYERIFPALVKEHSDIFYWPGSPWSEKSTRDQIEGDLHCWDVWHGQQAPYQDYGKLGGRFVSEFGMQGCPDIATVYQYLGKDHTECFSQSLTFGQHNKATGWEGRVAKYISDNIRVGPLLEDFVYATQFIQAEAITSAFSSWRRQFTGGVTGARCAGALVWQLNDVWPCMSWSIVDYFERPKPAYFAAKRALAPVSVGGRRFTSRIYPDRTSAAEYDDTTYIELFASASKRRPLKVQLVVTAYELLTGECLSRMEYDRTLTANRSSELIKFTIPANYKDVKNPVVVGARLIDPESQTTLAGVSLWPEPYKHLTFPSPEDVNLKVKTEPSSRNGESTLLVQAARPVKGLVLRSKDGNASFSDNFLDLLPGEPQRIVCKHLRREEELEWRYLGDTAC